MTRPELAIDVNGRAFRVPPEAAGWRARRIDGPGRPELVCDPMGRPVLLAIEASFEDLYRAAGPGKYRLFAVDAEGCECADVPQGVTGMMQPQNRLIDADGRETSVGIATGASFQTRDLRDDLLIHLITNQTRQAEAVIRGFPAMMTAAAELLSAADGAKNTSRQPLLAPLPTEEHEVELEPAPPPESRLPPWLRESIEAVVKTVVTQLGSKFAGKLTGGIPLEALFDWSKAAPKPPIDSTPPAAPHAGAAGASGRAAASIDPAWFAHAPGGTAPIDPAWFAAMAPSYAPAGDAAWTAAAPDSAAQTDAAWFGQGAGAAMPMDAAWTAAPSGPAPMPPASFPQPPTAYAPTDGAWFTGPSSPVAPSFATTSTAITGERRPAASEPTPTAPVAGGSLLAAAPSVAGTGASIEAMPIAGDPMLAESEARSATPMAIAPTPAASTPGMGEANTARPAVTGLSHPQLEPLAAREPTPSAGATRAPLSVTSLPTIPAVPGPYEASAGQPLRAARAPRAPSSSRAPARRGSAQPAPLSAPPHVPETALVQLAPPLPLHERIITDDSIAMPTHIMQIYDALTPQEQERTQQLVAMLSQEERVQWLFEIGSLSLPDAIARVRQLIHPHNRPSSGR